MLPLNARELTRAQADHVVMFLTETLTVSRHGASIPDGRGGRVPGPATTFTCKCRFVSRDADRRRVLIADASQVQYDGVIETPVSVEVRKEDTLAVGGRSYAVVSPDDEGGIKLCRRVKVSRI